MRALNIRVILLSGNRDYSVNQMTVTIAHYWIRAYKMINVQILWIMEDQSSNSLIRLWKRSNYCKEIKVCPLCYLFNTKPLDRAIPRDDGLSYPWNMAWVNRMMAKMIIQRTHRHPSTENQSAWNKRDAYYLNGFHHAHNSNTFK